MLVEEEVGEVEWVVVVVEEEWDGEEVVEGKKWFGFCIWTAVDNITYLNMIDYRPVIYIHEKRNKNDGVCTALSTNSKRNE